MEDEIRRAVRWVAQREGFAMNSRAAKLIEREMRKTLAKTGSDEDAILREMEKIGPTGKNIAILRRAGATWDEAADTVCPPAPKGRR